MKLLEGQQGSCDHGCGSAAMYISAKGKRCCQSNVAKCPAVKARIGKKNQAIRSKVDPNTGLTQAQQQAVNKRAHAASLGIEDPYKVAGQQMAATRRSIGSYDTFQEKVLATKRQVGEDGLTGLERATKKMVRTRQQADDTGITNYQRSARKATRTKLEDVDDKGRNGFDRMWITAGQAHEYEGTSLYYRSQLEKKWLDAQVELHGLEWVATNVQNGASIKYSHKAIQRTYLPDFVIGNVLYEIKSIYTWNNFGKNAEWEAENVAKLNAALSAGFDVRLVLDEHEHMWTEFRQA